MATDPNLLHFLHAGDIWRSSQSGVILEVEIQWLGPWINMRWMDQNGEEHRARVPLFVEKPAGKKGRKTPAPGRSRSPKTATNIFHVLEMKMKWLTGDELVAAFAELGLPGSDTTIKHEAAELVKEGRLKNRRPRYGLSSWPDP